MQHEQKLRVGVLCGGQSPEHEISLMSAHNVLEALSKDRYDVSVIFIDKQGRWFYFSDLAQFFKDASSGERVAINVGGEDFSLISVNGSRATFNLDVLFPILHGANGEDGTIQGLFEIANVPFVGAGVLGSAIAMDKDVTKCLLEEAGVKTVPWLTFTKRHANAINCDNIIAELGLPLFVKPANAGSSVGITKVKSRDELMPAVEIAFRIHKKILIEKGVAAREIECAVLGNEDPRASKLGEIVPNAEFYTYDAKYFDPNGASLHTPADLNPAVATEIQTIAKQAFEVIGCEGMARIDFLLCEKGEIYLNEVNPIPGFTEISMYPKLWSITGVHYPELMDQLIEYALARFKRDATYKKVSYAKSQTSKTS